MAVGQYRIRRVMAAGGVVFGLTGVFLVSVPGLFATLIGVVGVEADWAFRMMGVLLIPLSALLLMARTVLSAFAARGFAMLMIAVCLGLSGVTLLAPGPATVTRYGFIAVGLLFALAYAWALVSGGQTARRYR